MELKRILRIWILCFGLFLGFLNNAFSIERIISLAPNITKNLYLLEAENKLIGCTSYCSRAVKDGKQVVGSAIEVNMESIVTLKPDLVLVAEITSPEIISSIKKFGIEVEQFTTPDNFEGICNQLLDLGKLIDKEDIAQNIIKREKQKLEQVIQKVPENSRLKMFFQIGSNPVFTVLTNTFMNDFILLSGGENVCGELTRGTVSRELVVVRNPDVLLVSDMGKIGYEEKKAWESFNGMSAVKRKNVIVVDSDKSCSATITDFVEVLDSIITNINYR